LISISRYFQSIVSISYRNWNPDIESSLVQTCYPEGLLFQTKCKTVHRPRSSLPNDFDVVYVQKTSENGTQQLHKNDNYVK